jgi:hypothetical protein
VAALPIEAPPRAPEPTPPAQEAVLEEATAPTPAPVPEARVEPLPSESLDDEFEIVVGESLLAITGEYESTEWSSINPRDDADVEHPGDDGARLGSGGATDRRDSGGLRVTQESGLDWDSWDYGRNTSGFAAGDGLVINRHELPPEAAEVGLTGGAVDERGEDRFLRHESRPDAHRDAPDEGAPAAAPADPASLPDEPDDAAADAQPLMAEGHAAVVPEAPASYVREPAREEDTPDAEAERVSVSAADLEALKEVEPWALPPEPQPSSSSASASESVADRLERLAKRLRRGELDVPVDTPSGSDEAALAALLSALYRASQR